MGRRVFLYCLFLLSFAIAPRLSNAQTYDLFEISNDDVYWRCNFNYNGTSDSLRREVVQMLKSKFFTFNVIRNETGYNGEIRHYKVDCKKFGRSYYNTPRMYWYGEWIGKFIVEVHDNYYRVTIYGLYAEKFQPAGGYNNKSTSITTGRYFETVTRRDRQDFKKSEKPHLDLMSLSLKSDFDIRNTVVPTK